MINMDDLRLVLVELEQKRSDKEKMAALLERMDIILDKIKIRKSNVKK
jgi:hypothetical protein